MTQREIEATFNIVTIAGSETTATVLNGTLNYLTRNPGKLATLIKEARSAFSGEEGIDVKGVRELPYLNAVIDEGTRLCPPIPAGLPRLVPQGIRKPLLPAPLQDKALVNLSTGGDTVCGMHLPGGTYVSVHAWTLSRDPSCFTRPLEFLPERWLEQDNSGKSPPEFTNDKLRAVQPFSVGPRQCIGKNLARIEMLLILARFLWSFDVDSAEPGGKSNPKWEEQNTWMLLEKHPLLLKLLPSTSIIIIPPTLQSKAGDASLISQGLYLLSFVIQWESFTAVICTVRLVRHKAGRPMAPD
ncbi:MAG: hypothetical protein LQ340_003424 [Diploschistes diacapsis]|nr:MAG: hypothetical protein LQ340_003424 [Diploschistes diacapsis]